MFPECIFADVDVLLSWNFNDFEGQPNEFNRLLDEWDDVEFLTDFFMQHSSVLLDKWGILVSEAVIKTREKVSRFIRNSRRIMEIEDPDERGNELKKLFKPLSKSFIDIDCITETKIHVESTPGDNWLRFYALNIEGTYYIITGGAIKLTKRIDESEHTTEELRKLHRVKDYLAEQGIIDKEGFEEYLVELSL